MRRPAAAALDRVGGPARALARSFARAALGFALPQRCPGCGAPASARRVLCASCRALIPRLRTPLCARCLAAGRPPAGCTRHEGHAVFTPWVFDEHAAQVVHALKYGGRPSLAAPLGRTLAAAVPAAWRRPDLVLEVPLHPARERERGYNQAAALADALAGVLGAPRLRGALVRVRPTPPQARLGEDARRANVAGAFAVGRRAGLEGRRVLVVDDVMTTGATLEACLGVLGTAGAKAAGVTLAWTQ
jgi:ComF family protein